jgi:hypothetical protein
VVGTPTYTGKYKKLGNVTYWTLSVSSTTSTASVAGTTYFNLPSSIASPSVCSAINANGAINLGNGYISTSVCYTPTWSATSGPIIISGFYFNT